MSACPTISRPNCSTVISTPIDRLARTRPLRLGGDHLSVALRGQAPVRGRLAAGGPGDGAIGANVAAKRFFYAPHARRRGLRPPPGSPTLAALTPEVAALFSRAFLGAAGATGPAQPSGIWRSKSLAGRVVVLREGPRASPRARRALPVVHAGQTRTALLRQAGHPPRCIHRRRIDLAARLQRGGRARLGGDRRHCAADSGQRGDSKPNVPARSPCGSGRCAGGWRTPRARRS